MGIGETITKIYEITCCTFVAICFIYGKYFKGDDK